MPSGRQSLVEREAESFAQQKSRYPRRAKALRPTWDEFRSKTFTEYVQHALLDDEGDDEEVRVTDSSVFVVHDVELGLCFFDPVSYLCGHYIMWRELEL